MHGMKIIFEINYLKRLFEHIGQKNVYLKKEKNLVDSEKLSKNSLAKGCIKFCKLI